MPSKTQPRQAAIKPKSLTRTPPLDVRRQLRSEVGFGCPVPDCGVPYLQWHHFDPEWHIRHHHDPTRMIALCAKHHGKAGGGAYTKEQLREFKQLGRERAVEVKGEFEWMRRSLLAVVGGNVFYESLEILAVNRQPSIWFRRDEEGYLMLNIRMPSGSSEPRLLMEDNMWLVRGQPIDLDSPCSGKLLDVRYANGDGLRIEFLERTSSEATITCVEVHMKVAGKDIQIGRSSLRLPGVTYEECVFFNNRGFLLNVTEPSLRMP